MSNNLVQKNGNMNETSLKKNWKTTISFTIFVIWMKFYFFLFDNLERKISFLLFSFRLLCFCVHWCSCFIQFSVVLIHIKFKISVKNKEEICKQTNEVGISSGPPSISIGWLKIETYSLLISILESLRKNLNHTKNHLNITIGL